MPGLITRQIQLDDTWYPTAYWAWRPGEIVERWRDSAVLPGLIDLKKENRLIIIYCELERAPEYAALWMREVHDNVDCTYYDEKNQRLYLYYGAKHRNIRNQNEADIIFQEAQTRTFKLAEYIMKRPNQNTFYVDTTGATLFQKVA